jgi:hypothetical protein
MIFMKFTLSLFLMLCLLYLVGLYATEHTPPKIDSPIRGEYIHNLRPLVRVENIRNADEYVIEISPEPTFFNRNTISYFSGPGRNSHRLDGVLQKLRYEGLSKKYSRYSSPNLRPFEFKIPYNLTVMFNAPYGYRVIPCRNWLKFISGLIVEGYQDPLVALTEFASFAIVNEGSGTGYYNAYEVISKNMGVCGNVAELVAALASAQGFRSKILNLKAPDQGHVVAAVDAGNGWHLLDGLYNIIVPGSVEEIIDRVKRDPDYLNFDAFSGVKVPYRHFFHDCSYSYDIETSYPGIQCVAEKTDDHVMFDKLKYTCSIDMNNELAQQQSVRFSNIFFLRAAYKRFGVWSPWGYSYFIFIPPKNENERFAIFDNTAIWRHGFSLPAKYLGGNLIDSSRVTVISSETEKGYSASSALKGDGNAWLSTEPQGDPPFIGVDFGNQNIPVLMAVLIRWVTPTATPKTITIEFSLNGRVWKEVVKKDLNRSHPAMRRVDYIPFEVPCTGRFWRIVGEKGSPFALEQIGLIQPVY